MLLFREKSKKWAEQVAAAVCIQSLKLHYDGQLTVLSDTPSATNADSDAGRFTCSGAPLPHSSVCSVNQAHPGDVCRGNKRPLSPCNDVRPDNNINNRCCNNTSIEQELRALIDSVVAAEPGANNC